MIVFNDGKGDQVTQGQLETVFNLELGPKIFSAIADGPELLRAWSLLGRAGIPPLHSYVFIGDDAEEVFVNWVEQRSSAFGALA